MLTEIKESNRNFHFKILTAIIEELTFGISFGGCFQFLNVIHLKTYQKLSADESGFKKIS